MIKEGDYILVKIDFNTQYIFCYINGNAFKNNKIYIKDENCGYYPAFSLSSNKEIQVNFGGIYEMLYCSNFGKQLNKKPICQYNNLENIISCYMKIINNTLMKIINQRRLFFS